MVWRGLSGGEYHLHLDGNGSISAGSGRVRLTVRTEGRVSFLEFTFHCTCVSPSVSNGGGNGQG